MQRDQGGRGKQVVLVVDDNRFFLKMQRVLLERAGFAVLTAIDGQEGLDILGRFHDEIDVVVTDLMMPRLGGAEFCRKAKTRTPDLPIVLVTGVGDDETEQPDHFGFDAAIRKPFEPAELIGLIAELASQRERRTERRPASGA